MFAACTTQLPSLPSPHPRRASPPQPAESASRHAPPALAPVQKALSPAALLRGFTGPVIEGGSSRQEYIVQLTKDVIQQLPPIGQETAVSMLIDRIDDADDDVLSKLEEMIRQKRLRSGDTDHE